MLQRYLLGLLLASCAYTFALAQDPIFSQFYANRLYLNPAYTGVEPGITGTVSARSNYTSVQGGYNTVYGSVDFQEPYLRSGFGLSVWRDAVSDASFVTNNAAFNYAYHIRLSGKLAKFQQEILLGARAGFTQRSVDWSKLTFIDQYDPIQGNVRPTGAVPLNRKSAGYFDADAGLVWRSSYTLRNQRDMRSSVGLAASHLTQQDESLEGFPVRRPLRLTLHAATELPIVWNELGSHEISWSPNVKIDYQSNLTVFTGGVFAYYEGGFLGLFYQNRHPLVSLGLYGDTNAFIFNAGWRFEFEQKQTMVIGYSFDANTSGLSTASGGAHELSVRYTFGNFMLIRKRQAGYKQVLPCPKHF